jgi:hypothetical protein
VIGTRPPAGGGNAAGRKQLRSFAGLSTLSEHDQAAIARPIDKADTLLAAADGVLGTAAGRGLVSSGCAATLRGFVGEIRGCVLGLAWS